MSDNSITRPSSTEIIDIIDHYEKTASNPQAAGFVKLDKGMMATPAWRALSYGAQALYIRLKGRWNARRNNNGRLFLSCRKAAQELGASKNDAARWFRELKHHGFIACTTPGTRGVAPHWTLTELESANGKPAAIDYLRWNGTLFDSKRGVPEERYTRNANVPKIGTGCTENRDTKCTENRDVIRIKENKKISKNSPNRSSDDAGGKFKLEPPGSEDHHRAVRNEYPADFQTFWQSYPDRENNSKKSACAEWRKLSKADRRAATAALPEYATFLRKKRTKGDYQAIHAERFLKYRRFDGYAEQAAEKARQQAEQERIARENAAERERLKARAANWQHQYPEINVQVELVRMGYRDSHPLDEVARLLSKLNSEARSAREKSAKANIW